MISWGLSLSLTQVREPSPWWGRWQACLTDEGIVTLQEKSTCANLIGQWSVRNQYFQQFERFLNLYLKLLSFGSPHQSPYGDSFPTRGSLTHQPNLIYPINSNSSLSLTRRFEVVTPYDVLVLNSLLNPNLFLRNSYFVSDQPNHSP